MNIELIVVGKTDSAEVTKLVEMYAGRINFFIKFVINVVPDIKNSKNLSQNQQKQLEGEAILKRISTGDRVVLLDEKGKEYTSVEFATQIERIMSSGVKKLCFVIGGPYGFSEEVYSRADAKISLSRMTFSHQIVRAIFTEQLYRAYTILNNTPYHHS